ncbi:MAG: GGDEF domain-containing protein [Rubrivivax sp.]
MHPPTSATQPIEAPLLQPADGAAAQPCLVRYSGECPGQRIDLRDGELVLGRGEDADVRVDGRGVSRRHAALKIGAPGVVLFDLGSANRTYVNDVPVTEPVTLRDGDMVQLASVVFRFHDRRALDLAIQARVQQLAHTDAASGALTRKSVHGIAQRAFAQAAARGRPLVLLGCGMDHFASLCALHGSEAGDAVLRECATLMRAHLPDRAAIGRWATDEFAVVAGELGFEDALQLAERLRLAVAGHSFDLQVQVQGRLRRLLHRQSLSIGLASLRAEMRDVHDLQAAADRRLYAAKRDGGNRVVAVDLQRLSLGDLRAQN